MDCSSAKANKTCDVSFLISFASFSTDLDIHRTNIVHSRADKKRAGCTLIEGTLSNNLLQRRCFQFDEWQTCKDH